jgi:hypothetical protein
MTKHLPKFIGGTHNGEYLTEDYKVGGRWPGVFYLPTKITVEEDKALSIDDVHKWRAPDDVYDFHGANYVFRERVNYKPEELPVTPVDSTLDDFHDALNEEDTGISELVSDEHDTVVEMFETGSAEFMVNNRKFIVAVTFQEVKNGV